MKKCWNFIIFLQFKIWEKLQHLELEFEQYSSKILSRFWLNFWENFWKHLLKFQENFWEWILPKF